MNELYTRITTLCEEKGVSGYRLCKDTGLQPSFLTDLKSGRQHSLSAKKAKTVADYFGVTVEYLLTGEGRDGQERPAVTDDDIKFALFGGGEEITDEMYEEVKRFAQFVKQRGKQQ